MNDAAPALRIGTLLKWAITGWGQLVASSLGDVFTGKVDHPGKRFLWLLVVLPFLTVKLVVDGVCLLLDELFFPAAKEISLDGLLMVLGPPRSGTTFLHRVLSEDHATFGTPAAWEVFLAPSILQKKCCRVLGILDCKIGSPLVRLIRFTERSVLRAFEDTHPGSLFDPEEDYFYLGSVCACTGWQLVFPAWRGVRTWMPGQPEENSEHRKEALVLYRRFLQKQRYADPDHRRVLSKNASFASWMDLLPDGFPEAQFIVCMRDPAETIPSMLSTADASVRGAYAQQGKHRLQSVLIDEMKMHYRVLHEVAPKIPSDRLVVVAQQDLKNQLTDVVKAAARQLNLKLTEDFFDILQSKDEASRNYTSGHRYDLADMGLTASALREWCPIIRKTVLDGPHDSDPSENS